MRNVILPEVSPEYIRELLPGFHTHFSYRFNAELLGHRGKPGAIHPDKSVLRDAIINLGLNPLSLLTQMFLRMLFEKSPDHIRGIHGYTGLVTAAAAGFSARPGMTIVVD